MIINDVGEASFSFYTNVYHYFYAQNLHIFQINKYELNKQPEYGSKYSRLYIKQIQMNWNATERIPSILILRIYLNNIYWVKVQKGTQNSAIISNCFLYT